MSIPSIFLVKSTTFSEIVTLVEETSDNKEVGEKVREIVRQYKAGEFNPVPDNEFDNFE